MLALEDVLVLWDEDEASEEEDELWRLWRRRAATLDMDSEEQLRLLCLL